MSEIGTLRRTPLFELQKELGGRFVSFHGWDLPVQFSSILNEHRAVRQACGLFDVSHMGQVFVEGPDAAALLQKINCNDISLLKDGRALYSMMLNEGGGIIDDVIISRLSAERFLIVVNAATRENDAAWMRRNAAGMKVSIDDQSDALAMIAIQGPLSPKAIEAVSTEALGLKRFGAMELELFGVRCWITRTGYTGEDGFELITPSAVAGRAWQSLLARGESFGILPCGLGARDVLRLEAGYLLYGSDADAATTPFEARAGWVVKIEKGDFIGRGALRAAQPQRFLTPVKLLEKGVLRPGTEIFLEGKKAAVLTSATFSPSLQAGIGVGYFEAPVPPPGTKASAIIHGREASAEIVPAPFYKKLL